MKIHRPLFPAVSGALLAGLITLAGLRLVQAQNQSATGSYSLIAPFIIRDTATDSPGTNIVTRLVTLTAQVGGSPPPSSGNGKWIAVTALSPFPARRMPLSALATRNHQILDAMPSSPPISPVRPTPLRCRSS